jgi:serine/threonine protein phosphatase 1
MAHRSFAIGDIHGDLPALRTLLSRLPGLDAKDTLVFLGDYVDRGPDSAGTVEFLRFQLPRMTPAKVVCLRGNHEDAWLRVIRQQGWAGFTTPRSNGCYQCAESFLRRCPSLPCQEDVEQLIHSGGFFPTWAVHWFASLPFWYEDDHAIYVHAGLPMGEDGRWTHPQDVAERRKLVWERDHRFFTEYTGKKVVCGHTVTRTLPQELSRYTVNDHEDLFWAGRSAYLVDTGAGKPGGFLTALELPRRQVHESR